MSRIAHSYDAEITLQKGSEKANALSIFDLLILGAKKNDMLELSAVGCDAENALNAICAFLTSYVDIEISHNVPEGTDLDSYAA